MASPDSLHSKSHLSRRRAWLQKAAALGWFGPAGVAGLIQEALAKGDIPTAQGISSLTGEATVNGVAARVGTLVKPGDTIATAKGSSAVIVVGKDAYLLRENTRITFTAGTTPGVADKVLLVTGKVLSVFGKRGDGADGVQIRARNATIGIRGTGCYLEIHEGRTYFCLCYGTAVVDGGNMAHSKTITTTHHESPVWLDERGDVMKVEEAGFVNHNDAELIMLEKLQGREPPFVKMGLTGKY